MDGCPVFQTTPLLVMRTCKLENISGTIFQVQQWCLHSTVRTCFFQSFSLSSVQLVNRIEGVVSVSSAVHAPYLYFLVLGHQ